MSFYNVQNPYRVIQSDPSYRAQKNISFLQSGFQQPDGDNTNATVDDASLVFGGLIYSPQNLINRYIERTGSYGMLTFDFTPSAFEIVHTLNQNQSIHQDSHLFAETPVRKGFYFDFHIYNETDHQIMLQPGNGVSFGGIAATGPVINPDGLSTFRCIVTNATAATGTAAVYISELSCCDGYVIPPG